MLYSDIVLLDFGPQLYTVVWERCDGCGFSIGYPNSCLEQGGFNTIDDARKAAIAEVLYNTITSSDIASWNNGELTPLMERVVDSLNSWSYKLQIYGDSIENVKIIVK